MALVGVVRISRQKNGIARRRTAKAATIVFGASRLPGRRLKGSAASVAARRGIEKNGGVNNQQNKARSISKKRHGGGGHQHRHIEKRRLNSGWHGRRHHLACGASALHQHSKIIADDEAEDMAAAAEAKK